MPLERTLTAGDRTAEAKKFMWLKKFLVSRGADREVLDKLNGSQALRRYGLQNGYIRTGDEPDEPEGASAEEPDPTEEAKRAQLAQQQAADLQRIEAQRKDVIASHSLLQAVCGNSSLRSAQESDGAETGANSEARAPFAAPWMRLRDYHGTSVLLSANSTDGGSFQDPVFLCKHARLSRKQTKPQPVLLLTARDWVFLKNPKTTHANAFGCDADKSSFRTMSENYLEGNYDPRHTGWVMVWKFPGDLNRISGYLPIYDTPLPVGNYRFRDDRWWQPAKEHNIPSLRIGCNKMEKLRIDSAENNTGVHYLEDNHGIRVAMVGTNPWIREYWGATPEEQSNCSLMFQEMYERAQVYAFACYKTHHAIIFYADLSGSGQTLITPSRLADILNNESRGVLRILEKHQTCSKDLKSWAHNYIRLFLQPAVPENLPAEQMEATGITTDAEVTINQPGDDLRFDSRAVSLAPHQGTSAEADGSAGLRLVFLDVDGVLAAGKRSPFWEDAMSQLQRIVDTLGARIVMTSSWRMLKSLTKRFEHELEERGFQPMHGATPVISKNHRDQEIAQYIKDCQECVEAWVAIDDLDLVPQSDSWPANNPLHGAMQGHMVAVDEKVGLTNVDADRAIATFYQQLSKIEDVTK